MFRSAVPALLTLGTLAACGTPAAADTGKPPAADHWAFRPIRKPAPPAVASPGWVRNPIDAFVLARLEREGVEPSPEADRVTLIRRAYLDLTGLPPTPAEVDAFLADESPGAYEKVVDRLLASPHYGERWGRHWLDAARYADSDGYEKDSGRPFAWRWRDWVIDALNRDLPFDRFTIEQLAGDLLPGGTTEQLIATGFHRNTLRNREGGVDPEQFRVEAVVDRVNTTGTVWLGLTVGCAQCHDHKYDPISQKEYYRLFAFFNSDVEEDVPAPLPHRDEEFAREQAEFERKADELTRAVRQRREQLAKLQAEWEKDLNPEAAAKLPEDIQAILKLPAAMRSAGQKKALADHFARSDAELARRQKALAAHRKAAPQPALAQVLKLGPPRKTHVMARGDFLRPGEEVRPGTPAVLPPMPDGPNPTRLDLANWIVSPENPLTARVTVNWVWQKYFGRGLVETLEDFGTRSTPPSHPELLDWLAGEFKDRGWGVKDLHRLIVTSATYRQSSKDRPELRGRDPRNVLLARQARLRLSAEAVRDSALAASGLLAPVIGGPSVRPPQPPGVSELTYAGSAKWVESRGPDRYRRGLYIWFQRTSPFPMLMTFDAPDSNVCAVRRERSNTPLQALTLLNDVAFVECAQALGRRIAGEEPGGVAERVAYGFRLCVAREPTSAERARLVRLFGELRALAAADPAGAAELAGPHRPPGADPAEAAAWAALARALLNLDEFVTRE